jgi:hypothetical protein
MRRGLWVSVCGPDRSAPARAALYAEFHINRMVLLLCGKYR